ncbi:DUF2642 domain-containing protein [Virgibacillus necropolis]|uniref:DUF2642 domain-containing protein n=1 Tax=Virgibacillus necropolis TaxID=163877 RepID=A0A221M9W8_9BACI|nr:DUF2642 domain-containing protein [Virgibacillus necropolis]ASN04435.1 hypothetical protein CFK40_05130 [Virgibacillus necropolis]
MFEETFAAELANRIGSRVEVATDNNLIEGILSNVTEDSVRVDVNGGYGGYGQNRLFISIDAINFVRFPLVA